MLHTTEQILGKTASQRNLHLKSLTDARIKNNSSGYCGSFQDCLSSTFSRISIGNLNNGGITIHSILSLCHENNDMTKILWRNFEKDALELQYFLFQGVNLRS